MLGRHPHGLRLQRHRGPARHDRLHASSARARSRAAAPRLTRSSRTRSTGRPPPTGSRSPRPRRYVNGSQFFTIAWSSQRRHGRRPLQGLRRGRLLLRRQRPRHRDLHPGAAAVHRRHQRRHRQLRWLRRGPGHHGVVALPGARLRQRATQPGLGQDQRRRGQRRHPTFDDSVVGEQVDNAGAVEWDQYANGAGLAANATATSRSLPAARFPRRCRSTRPTRARPRACRSTSPSVRCRHQRRAVRGQDDPLRDHGRRTRRRRAGDRRRRWQRGDHRSGHQRRAPTPSSPSSTSTTTARARPPSRRPPRWRPSSTTSRRRARSRSAATGPAAAAARASR